MIHDYIMFISWLHPLVILGLEGLENKAHHATWKAARDIWCPGRVPKSLEMCIDISVCIKPPMEDRAVAAQIPFRVQLRLLLKSITSATPIPAVTMPFVLNGRWLLTQEMASRWPFNLFSLWHEDMDPRNVSICLKCAFYEIHLIRHQLFEMFAEQKLLDLWLLIHKHLIDMCPRV